MSLHPLDFPARTALTTHHARFARTDGPAMRYDPGTIPFATATDPDDPALHEAFARLVAPGDRIAFPEPEPFPPMPGFEEFVRLPLFQMIRSVPQPYTPHPEIVALNLADAADMLALAEAAKPGPFTLRVLEIGRFWGIRREGRLVAMAGTRLSVEGFTEVSGVCVDETARGQGLGKTLSRHVCAAIEATGATPFLHVERAKTGAVALYRGLGFTERAAMHVTAYTRL